MLGQHLDCGGEFFVRHGNKRFFSFCFFRPDRDTQLVGMKGEPVNERGFDLIRLGDNPP